MRWIALLLVGLLFPGLASAQTLWTVASGAPGENEGPKFGYTHEGDNHFSTLFAYCFRDTKEAVVLADVGERAPTDGESSFTLTVNGEPPVTVRGTAELSMFDGHYWLRARLTLDHPMFELLSRG